MFDSVGGLKDGEQKEHLADMVRDVFSNPTEALANKEELSKVLDSVYINISGNSIAEIREGYDSYFCCNRYQGRRYQGSRF